MIRKTDGDDAGFHVQRSTIIDLKTDGFASSSGVKEKNAHTTINESMVVDSEDLEEQKMTPISYEDRMLLNSHK